MYLHACSSPAAIEFCYRYARFVKMNRAIEVLAKIIFQECSDGSRAGSIIHPRVFAIPSSRWAPRSAKPCLRVEKVSDAWEIVDSSFEEGFRGLGFFFVASDGLAFIQHVKECLFLPDRIDRFQMDFSCERITIRIILLSVNPCRGARSSVK